MLAASQEALTAGRATPAHRCRHISLCTALMEYPSGAAWTPPGLGSARAGHAPLLVSSTVTLFLPSSQSPSCCVFLQSCSLLSPVRLLEGWQMPRGHQSHPVPEHWAPVPCAPQGCPQPRNALLATPALLKRTGGPAGQAGRFWSWSDMQQHSQVPRNEIPWRIAEASVLALLANRAQIGAACHLLSIPSCKPSPGAGDHSVPAARASQHLQPCSQSSPFHARSALFWRGLSCSLALSMAFCWTWAVGVPPAGLGPELTSPWACWGAPELSSPLPSCRSAVTRGLGTAQLAEIQVLMEFIGVEGGAENVLWWVGNLPNVPALWVCLLVAHVCLLGFRVFSEEDASCDLSVWAAVSLTHRFFKKILHSF